MVKYGENYCLKEIKYSNKRLIMELGAFSVSLKVKNLQQSIDFYEKLGFTHKGGNPEQNWVVLKNGTTVIGLFQDIIEENYLTFNPGWGSNGENLEEFTDVRELQKSLRNRGIVLERAAAEDGTGPEYLFLSDPDGNKILIDQHR